MTHSLHRQGDRKSLKNDFVFLMDHAVGFNDKGVAPKAAKVIDALMEAGAINWSDRQQVGDGKLRTSEEYKEGLSDKTRLRGVLPSKESVVTFMKRLKLEDPGMSITISGLLDEIDEACKETAITPHTINFSLGVWGNTAVLPPDEILALTTMCGHHLISAQLVKKGIEDIKAHKRTVDDVCASLSKLCPCGLFNQERAKKLLAEYTTYS
jgi:hypothetical protein